MPGDRQSPWQGHSGRREDVCDQWLVSPAWDGIKEAKMRVKLIVVVKGSDKSRMICRTIEMPSAPFIGMLVCGITRKGSNLWDWPVEKVTWNVEDQCFEADMKRDEEQVGEQTTQEMIDDEWGDEWQDLE